MASRKPATASTSQFGTRYFFHHLLRVIFRQYPGQGFKAPIVEVFLNTGGIDDSVVPKGDPRLAVEECDFPIQFEKVLTDGLFLHPQSLHNPSVLNVFADDFLKIFQS